MRTVGVNFGALCAPISYQLTKQGLTADEKDIAFWQRCADAISLLSIHDLVTDAAKKQARRKLLRRIAGKVRVAAEPFGVKAEAKLAEGGSDER